MSWTLALQLFLLLNIFLVGGLTVLAAQHAYAHFRPGAGSLDHDNSHNRAQPKHHGWPAAGGDDDDAITGEDLPPDVKQQMIDEATQNFQAMLDRSTDELGHDLGEVTRRLNKTVEKMGTEVASDEMDRYRETMKQLRAQAEVGISSMGSNLAAHQSALKTQLDAFAELEKHQLKTDLDAKLADTVAAFLTETLQHNIDLGAQGPYLKSTLEAHKDELIETVTK